jgi:hypothetical protein
MFSLNLAMLSVREEWSPDYALLGNVELKAQIGLSFLSLRVIAWTASMLSVCLCGFSAMKRGCVLKMSWVMRVTSLILVMMNTLGFSQAFLAVTQIRIGFPMNVYRG